MTNSKFEARVKASGLRPKSADMPMLEALVRDLDRAAAALRGPAALRARTAERVPPKPGAGG